MAAQRMLGIAADLERMYPRFPRLAERRRYVDGHPLEIRPDCDRQRRRIGRASATLADILTVNNSLVASSSLR